MAEFLVAIGGQGQHIALAYLILAKRFKFEPADIYLIDADRALGENPLTAAINSAAGEKGGKLKLLDPVPDLKGTSGGLNEFREMFRTVSGREERVLKLLFTDAQLRTPVSRGMYGNPSVGACTFLAAIKGEGNAKIKDFLNALPRTNEPHRVVLVSSALGGTGTGGTPAILHELIAEIAEDEQSQRKKYNVQVTSISLLPWFQLQEPQQERPEDPPVRDPDILSNYHSYVEYMRITFGEVDSVRLIFLGARDWDRPEIPSRGNVNQPINPHYLHLVAATISRQCLTEGTNKFESGIYGQLVTGSGHPVVNEMGGWEARNLETGEVLRTLDFFGLDSPKFPFSLGGAKAWQTVKNMGRKAREGKGEGFWFLLPGNINPEGGEREGLAAISEQGQMEIFDQLEVSPERLPTPFSHAFEFARRLAAKVPASAKDKQKESIENKKEKAIVDLLLLRKGFFYRILKTSAEIRWNEIGLLGQVLYSWLPKLKNFGLLTWRDNDIEIDIGSFYPETFAFFSHNISQETKNALAQEINKFEKKYPKAEDGFWDRIGEAKEADPLWKKVLYGISSRRKR